VSAVCDAKNTGFDYDYNCPGGPVEQAKSIRNPGHPPIVVDPVGCTLSFPVELDARYEAYDFAMRSRGGMKMEKNTLRLPAQTDWMGVLKIAGRGASAEPLVDASTGVAVVEGAAQGQSGETTDPKLAGIPNPLPDVSWGDSYQRAHRILRDGTMRKASVSPQDLSSKAEKTIAIGADKFLMGMPANVEVLFKGERMTRIAVTFTQAPAFAELVAQFEKTFGAPTAKKLVNTAAEQSEVQWELKKAGGTLSIIATEVQGVVRVAYVCH
jgi:hypothetical protein